MMTMRMMTNMMTVMIAIIVTDFALPMLSS